MQWLIDIIKEWHDAWFASYGGFHDHGDPADPDFQIHHFTTDFNWHELDLSAIVPEGAKGVCIRATGASLLAYAKLQFRKKGNVNEWNTSRLYTEVALLAISKDCTLALDVDRKIEYKATDVTWVYLDVIVKNWWF